tara:strand:+ start:610 stop:2076 length:1467 start_codon:yes stop_codon:yes gene_type:complete
MDVIELNPDIIEIGDLDEPELRLDIEESQTRPSVNFGSGIELLMNDKKSEKKGNSSVEIDDISKLEDELNDLSDTINTESTNKKISEPSSNKSIFNGLFGDKIDGENVKHVTQNNAGKANLGKATSNMNENKTWDGFGKFNNVPVNLDKVDKKPELTKEEELKEKFKYLRKLEDLERKGVTLSKRYNMDSNLQEMMGEYETIIAEKERTNSMKFQGKMLMACVTGLEFLNNKFDPFDVKLEGWGEQLNENIDEYDDIFGELHEKYKSKAKMSPELKLLFQLGGSAVMVHMSNTLFKSAMPGMDDIMRQNPELMKQFTSAAVNTMGSNGNPGFAGFMNGVFGNNSGGGPPPQNDSGLGFGPSMRRDMPPNVNEGPPPPPVETKLPERSGRTQNLSNRPDLMSARGVSINENEGYTENEERISRPEMRGPSSKQSEINSLLSGLKTKQINVDNKELSTISIDDLKDLTNAKIPKSKRKQKSDKNIVSLDI